MIGKGMREVSGLLVIFVSVVVIWEVHVAKILSNFYCYLFCVHALLDTHRSAENACFIKRPTLPN